MPSFFISQNPNNMSFRTKITAPIRLFRTLFSSHTCLLLAATETKSLSCPKLCSQSSFSWTTTPPPPPWPGKSPHQAMLTILPWATIPLQIPSVSYADYYFLTELHFLCHNPQHSPQSHTEQDHDWVADWMLSKMECGTRQITNLPLVSFGLLLYCNSIPDHVSSGFQ